MRPYISGGDQEVPRELAFDDEVPRLNVTSLQLAGANAAFQRLGRERNRSAADIDVTAADLRDTRRQSPGWGEAIGTRKVRPYGERVESTKRPGER